MSGHPDEYEVAQLTASDHEAQDVENSSPIEGRDGAMQSPVAASGGAGNTEYADKETRSEPTEQWEWMYDVDYSQLAVKAMQPLFLHHWLMQPVHYR